MTESQATSMTLHARLRELRRRGLPGRGSVRQADLSRALDVAVSSVSSWETNKIPPTERLLAYATFFSSPRSVEATPPRLLGDDELTTDELVERDRLLAELQELRTVAVGGLDEPRDAGRGLWHFPDGGPVRILCGALEPGTRPRFASPRDPNYMMLSAYADLDALVELFGHVRAENPGSDVQFELAARLESDDLPTHLVILGNMGRDQLGVFSGLERLPVRQVDDAATPDGEVFEVVTTGELIRPTLDPDAADEVAEDVGLFVRTANPNNSTRTLTICSGVFTRGVYGAVRCLTDANFRAANEEWLRRRFGGAETYGVLMRVGFHDRAVATPDLRRLENRLYEFSSDD